MRALTNDLRLMPDPYRKPLGDYIFYGVRPIGVPVLSAALDGKRDLAVQLDAAAATIIFAFLDCHTDPLDIAHGHPALVLRWQWLGGWEGRQ